jgi:phosphoadenosine phosphosulfate reductase
MEIIHSVELNLLNHRHAGSSAEEILRSAHERWGEKLGMTTAFGYSGVYLMSLLTRMGIYPDIYFIDTGYHFPETYEFAEQLKERWGVNIHTICTDEQIRRYVTEELGAEPWKSNPNLCCHFLKVAPLLQVLPEKDAWISALRRDQSSSRKGIDIFQLDSRGTLKVHPLAHYSGEEVWEEIRRDEIPYHPLHDDGYLSIGCAPCTSPARAGEDERSGRWRGSGKLECGLHL